MRPSSRPATRRGAKGGISPAYWFVLGSTALVGLVVFYWYVYSSLRSLKGSRDESPSIVANNLGRAGQAIANAITGNCPKCEAAAPPDEDDKDVWLDSVGDKPPPIVPSHFAQVHGIEPFEQHDLKEWHLHTVPTDDWYDRAKRATDRCDLELSYQTQGADKGLEDKIVWVSGLWDLKRGDKESGSFQRSMSEYYSRFQRVLDNGFQMIIYIPPEFEEHLKIDKTRVHIIHMHGSDLQTYFPYWDRLQAIRTSKLWKHQGDVAGWLAEAPQSKLPQYNPLVMSKFFLLRDAARLNPWGSRYHLWMDAGHLCAGGQHPDAAGTSMYRKHMASALLVTSWPYGTQTEVHGLADRAMHLYMAQAEDPLRIVRGGIFGGTLPYIECALKAYVIALHQTLSDGYVGTEECIWAIIVKRFPHLFAPFDNNSLGNHGDNCASFVKSTMEEREIKEGKRELFVSPAVPKYPSWWDAAQKLTKQGATGAAAKGDLARLPKEVAALIKAGGLSAKAAAGGSAASPPLRGAAATAAAV